MLRIILVFAIIIASQSLEACTTFFINRNGQMVFGRNYDWVTGNGFITENKSGLKKTSFHLQDGPTISWVSKYGSITFNQYGKEFPNGGMNEQGLVVELMWLEETKFEPVDGRPSLNVLQWIQYQLDNYSTVEQVLEHLKETRISSTGNIPLHYLIADASGKVATLEILDGKKVVHSGKDLHIPVLTNNTYQQSTNYLNQQQSEESRNQGFQNSSLKRFAIACRMVSEYQNASTVNLAPVEQAFTILNEVKQGSFTKWSIVYDLKKKEIFFQTQEVPARRKLALTSFDFSCSNPSSFYPLSQGGTGDIRSAFRPYSKMENESILKLSLKESAMYVRIPEDLVSQMISYPSTPSCQK